MSWKALLTLYLLDYLINIATHFWLQVVTRYGLPQIQVVEN